ncbi:ABC transporter substrate-binding protein [Deinococcus lacus]|uniref:ABC transporter substrate-binding protein n=1 Tax=Deinococcus lacus TaxID=392561 RepID=A0ABW1YB81_9DEIO
MVPAAPERYSGFHPHKVTFELDGPDAYFAHRLSNTLALIRPAHAPDCTPPVGSGPFRWTTLPEGCRLTAFAHHFKERPLIDEVEIYHVDPMSEHSGALWDIQGDGAQPAGDEAVLTFTEGVQYFIWNTHRPLAHSQALRQAVFGLLEMNRVWQDCFPAEPFQAASSFSEARSPSRLVEDRPHSAGAIKARETLKALLPLQTPLRIATVDRWDAAPIAQWLASQLRECGVPTEVEIFHLSQSGWQEGADLYLLAEVHDADEQMAFWQMMHDPSLGFQQWLPRPMLAKSSGILGGFRTAQSFGERERLIAEVEHLLISTGWVFLTHHRQVYRRHHPLMRGVQPGAFGRIDFGQLWLE